MRLLPALALILALAACAGPTRYQPSATPTAMGWREQMIEPGRWRVTFQGAPGAPPAQVSDYALLRAAQITVRDNDDWFRITARYGSARPGPAGEVSVGGGGVGYGRGGGIGLGLGASFPIAGGPALAATVEFVEGRGAAPAGVDVYDARGVIKAISPRATP